MEETMRAMVFEQFGGPEQYVPRDIPVPIPGEEEIRIKVHAFGVNRAEAYLRRGLFGQASRVSGIECVGEVDADPSGAWRPGQTVAAIVGGMARTRDGSYAEYTCVPMTNVFHLDTTLSWADLAAIPESYATAWTCLFENLKLTPGQLLLIRGATSALGQAALNIAADTGATILATTRSAAKSALLLELGATGVLIDNGSLAEAIRKRYPDGIDGALDLVGNSTLRDSLRSLKKGGRLCLAGFLGGGEPVEAFNPILDMPSGVDLNTFASAFTYGTPDFPLTDIPMQGIVDKVANGTYKAKPVKVFPFEQLADAHRLMESDEAGGKIVVVL
jgi:NADPH:quinone reductase-like Zn-dependent oxidoreductase